MGIQTSGYIRAGNAYLQRCHEVLCLLTVVGANLAWRAVGLTGASMRRWISCQAVKGCGIAIITCALVPLA